MLLILQAKLTLEDQAVIKLLELDISAKAARTAVKKEIGNSKVSQPLATGSNDFIGINTK